MRGNRKHDTQPELLLRNELLRLGLCFRRHVQDLPGEPDFVFPQVKVVVFCDGDFWHGRNWRNLRAKLARRANAEYWIAKIKMNRKRDVVKHVALQGKGWCVVRLWETDIKQDPYAAAAQVMLSILARQRSRRIGDECQTS